MIFRILGQIVRRAWPLLLIAWVALAAGTYLAAPAWSKVAQNREFVFLPKNAPSRLAQEEFAKAFPEDRTASNVVLVLHRPQAPAAHLAEDQKFIETVLEPALRRIATAEGGLASEPAPSEEPLFGPPDEPAPPPPKRSIIFRITTPNAPGTGALLISPDSKVLLVVVSLTTDFLDPTNWPTLAKIENVVEQLKREGKIPPGMEIAVTGSAAIGRDNTMAQLQSARATSRLTVLLVVVLLILIYRAPLLAIIPLATVYLAVQVSLNVLAILADSGHVLLFQGIEIYITILAYGAGVDYCLFLTARYREELERGLEPAEAVAGAVAAVGGALVASAATVICGIGMMLFADFGKFHEAGYAIPLGLALVLCATLTFSPSLLRLAGRWAFWPHLGAPATQEGAGSALRRIWDRVGQLLLRRAGTVWLITAGLMAPFAIAAGVFYNRLSYDMIGDLPADAPSVAGTRLLEKHFPAGIVGPVTLLLVNPAVKFDRSTGWDLVERVTDRLRQERKALGLADIRSLTAPLGITAAAAHPFADSDLPPEVRRQAARRAAREHYTTALGGRYWVGIRLDLILKQSPFSQASMDDLDRIEQTVRSALPENLRQGTALYTIGTTASVRDLAQVIQGDRVRIERLVLMSVFVVLLVLLRRFVVTVYLLLTVLFSYYATLGVTFAVFWLLDPHGFTGIDWRVAIFLFTILIAVGEDYNIFLMTRVDEESRRFGPVRGVTEALDRTGPIITSCGIIMAGTFASLLGGSLAQMKQLGFALAFGVVLDTFVVRPILVPAFLILLRSGRLGFWRRKE